MKKILLILAAVVLLSFWSGAAAEEQTLTILFTHDMHSHLDSMMGENGEYGGLTRMKTVLDQRRAAHPDALLLDGGDFSMGTLYQTVYETHAAELSMMGRLGYDATTFGNHEFDYRGEGAKNMLASAVREAKKDGGYPLPAFVYSNIDWAKNTSEACVALRAALDDYGAGTYTVIERGGLRVGVFGLFGKDADACAPLSGMVFDDAIESAKKAVAGLKGEKVDAIVCLSHGGTSADPRNSEDELLAGAVPDIDVIVSGHTHTTLEKPIVKGHTVIVSSGSYTQSLGEITLSRDADGRWTAREYLLHPIDETVAKDPQITAELEKYRAAVDSEYLSRFGYTFDQVLAQNPVDFGSDADVQGTQNESPLGDLLADAFVHAVREAEGESYRKVDWAVTALGVIRGSFAKGPLTVSDVFNVSSLGIGPDRVPGYPLIDVYLTADDLRAAAEVDASISALMPSAKLFVSGGGWEYNPRRLFMNRVTDVWTLDEAGEKQPLENGKLYRVVVDLYMGQMLGSVQGQSFGLLSVTPRDENGNPVTDFETRVLHDQTGNELKEWAAVAGYLQSLPTLNGEPVVPQRYEQPEGRKLVDDSTDLVELLKQPNKVFWLLLAALAFVLALLAMIGRLIARLIRRLGARRAKAAA